MPVSLPDLIRALPDAAYSPELPARLVGGLAYDSRRVQPDDIFVALPGLRAHGVQFARKAEQAGAVAVVSDAPAPGGIGIPLVLVPNAREALGDLSSAFYDYPARAMRLVGVTGTDGKTTVSRLIGEIVARSGIKAGWLTTVDVRIGDQLRKNPFGYTTPEAPEVQRSLAEMRDAGVQIAIVEASSHALALDRLRGCEFEIGVFTNLAPEHLNFHGSIEEYSRAKGRLFRVPSLRWAVLNADDPSSALVVEGSRAAVRRYGTNSEADLWGDDLDDRADGVELTLHWKDELAGSGSRLATRFPGRFNVSNWLAACLASRLMGASVEAMEQAAREVEPPPGRMQDVRAGQPFRVVVDFSHTPQSLESALRALRPFTAGRLLAAFGHAGERDPENRPAMGAAGALFADYFAITTDDPMDEDPAEIAARVADGATRLGRTEGRDFSIVLDRRESFRHLLELARPGDTVLLAGRGHEDVMPTAGVDVPFNDAQVAREILAELGYPSDRRE